jgi:hypothetical protein
MRRESDGAHKVGQSIDPIKRHLGVKHDVGCSVRVVSMLECSRGDALMVEQLAHAFLWQHRIDGEWFTADLETIENAIRTAARWQDVADFQRRRSEAVERIEAEWGRRPTRAEIRELQVAGVVPSNV